MVPDRTFFATQQRFAERWAAVASVPIETAYLECTTWYHQAARLGRDFDPFHPDWQRLLAEVAASREPDAVVHAWAVACERPAERGPVLDFAWSAEDRPVQLNFLGERSRERSPLSDAHLPDRRRELRDLMMRAANDHPEAESLRGRSWALRAGCVSADLSTRLSGWPRRRAAGSAVPRHLGQLLHRNGGSRSEIAARLLVAADAASTTTDLENAFPLPLWQTRASFVAVAEALNTV